MKLTCQIQVWRRSTKSHDSANLKRRQKVYLSIHSHYVNLSIFLLCCIHDKLHEELYFRGSMLFLCEWSITFVKTFIAEIITFVNHFQDAIYIWLKNIPQIIGMIEYQITSEVIRNDSSFKMGKSFNVFWPTRYTDIIKGYSISKMYITMVYFSKCQG